MQKTETIDLNNPSILTKKIIIPDILHTLKSQKINIVINKFHIQKTENNIIYIKRQP